MSERDGEVEEDGKDCNKDERGSERDGEVNKINSQKHVTVVPENDGKEKDPEKEDPKEEERLKDKRERERERENTEALPVIAPLKNEGSPVIPPPKNTEGVQQILPPNLIEGLAACPSPKFENI